MFGCGERIGIAEGEGYTRNDKLNATDDDSITATELVKDLAALERKEYS